MAQVVPAEVGDPGSLEDSCKRATTSIQADCVTHIAALSPGSTADFSRPSARPGRHSTSKAEISGLRRQRKWGSAKKPISVTAARAHRWQVLPDSTLKAAARFHDPGARTP